VKGRYHGITKCFTKSYKSLLILHSFFLAFQQISNFFSEISKQIFQLNRLNLHCQVLLLLLAVAQESGQAVRGIAKILMINFHKTFDYIVYHLLYIMEHIFSDYV